MERVYKKKVSYHETDCMGVVHHSVYAKYFEDARVNFLYLHNIEDFHVPKVDYALALTSLEVKYLKPLRLFDEFEVGLSVRALNSLKFEFIYEVYLDKELVTTGKTLHVGLNSEFKVVKPPCELYKVLKETVEKGRK